MAPHPVNPATSGDGATLERDVPGTIRYLGRPDEPAGVDLLKRPSRERAIRAAQGWGLCWGAAVVAVFIPLLHFILVPSLLVAGPLVARARWQERATVRNVRGRCPGCGAAIDAMLNSPAAAEIAWRCAACGRALVLHLDVARLDPAAASHAPGAGA